MDMFVHRCPWAPTSRCRVQGAIEGTSVIPENIYREVKMMFGLSLQLQASKILEFSTNRKKFDEFSEFRESNKSLKHELESI